MNHTDLLSLKTNLRAAISRSETIERLWATCHKIITEMNYDYFLYQIQHPTPFTNPKTYTYGNYPFDTSRLLTNKIPHRTTGHFKVSPEHQETSTQTQKQETTVTINANDSIFLITQSTKKTEGTLVHFLLARRNHKIDHLELKSTRTLIKAMTDGIHNRLFELNNPTPQKTTLSSREKEILLWGADGKTSEEIAIILGLSQDSINFHHKAIQRKLGTTNRAQAIAHAIVKNYI